MPAGRVSEHLGCTQNHVLNGHRGTCMAVTLAFRAVRDLPRIVAEPELHPANPLPALWPRQLPAAARQK